MDFPLQELPDMERQPASVLAVHDLIAVMVAINLCGLLLLISSGSNDTPAKSLDPRTLSGSWWGRGQHLNVVSVEIPLLYKQQRFQRRLN